MPGAMLSESVFLFLKRRLQDIFSWVTPGLLYTVFEYTPFINMICDKASGHQEAEP